MNLIPDKAFEKAVEKIGEMTKEPVGNLLNPPTKVIGESLAGILKMTFLPFSLAGITAEHLLKRAEYFYSRIEANLEIIPEEKRCEPPLNVVGPALEAAKYHIEDDTLCEMFATLVASAMNTDTRDATHPSFVEIIKQLSPVDAKILYNFLNEDMCDDFRNHTIFTYSVNFRDGGDMYSIENVSNRLCPDASMTESSSSITNLIRLAILKAKPIDQKIPTYPNFINEISDLEIKNLFYSWLKLEIQEDADNEIKKAIVKKPYWLSLTSFGAEFCDVCIRNHN